jgi:hypothetical protein
MVFSLGSTSESTGGFINHIDTKTHVGAVKLESLRVEPGHYSFKNES